MIRFRAYRSLISFVYVIHYLFFFCSWRLNGTDVFLPKIYKRDIIAVYYFFFLSKSKQAYCGSNEREHCRQRDRTSFVFLHVFNVHEFCPFDSSSSSSSLSWEISQTSHATCGPRWGNLDLSPNAIAREDIYIYSWPLGWQSSKNSPISRDHRCFPSRVILFSRSRKFRAHIEIEARSPDDRNIPQKCTIKFLSQFRHLSLAYSLLVPPRYTLPQETLTIYSKCTLYPFPL